ncbi:MAG TPA: MoxR family ATPase [Candidatus Deferrimicrobium sp.]|nr:MoxR family ATPase [Candidatus Deferrimicrobium sp.]
MTLTIDNLARAFSEAGYVTGEDDQILITVYLALKLGKPLLVTGVPGVGKTEIAKVLSKAFNAELIRLQCYEGLDEHKALYEWNYQRQLLRIQMMKDQQDVGEKDLFSTDYLLARPLLRAIQNTEPTVLLIDEIDKTDEEFEAFLFEVLSDFQVSIPELGTLSAKQTPMVILTSNGDRELSDGLKRRCVFLYVDLPSIEKEYRIIRAKVPEAGEKLSRQVAQALAILRSNVELSKLPSISETLDWIRALVTLESERLTPEVVDHTLNLLLKSKEDLDSFQVGLGSRCLVDQVLTAEHKNSGR